MTWLANIHSSMFYNIYCFMRTHDDGGDLQALIKSYRLYLEQADLPEGNVVLDFTRAYTMVRFFDSGMLQLNSCCRCNGEFVAHAYDDKHDYVCVLCRPPSRAGKVRNSDKPAQPRRTARRALGRPGLTAGLAGVALGCAAAVG